MSEAELEEFYTMLPDDAKRKWYQRIKAALPEVPKWLTFEEQVKTAQLHLTNNLIPGIAPREREEQDPHPDTPQQQTC